MTGGAARAVDALVIGGGPAGLMAAEALLRAGRHVTLADAKPSLGRKFLMAGKSGLTLTKEEPFPTFLSAFGAAAEPLRPMLAQMGPPQVVAFAEGLGQAVFTGSSGRVFPKAMKASPLLRAWLARLDLDLRTRWRWTDLSDGEWRFETPEGVQTLRPRAVVLALGGASWARLGSDGRWADALRRHGVACHPFKPANMGFGVDWSPHMAPHFGAPVKSVALRAADGTWRRGEFAVSARGVEGGGIYAVAADVRDGAPLVVDLCPDLTQAEVTERLARRPKKRTLAQYLARALRFDPVKRAMLQEFGRPLPEGEALAALIKALPIRHTGPRPMDEAISTAGGVAWDSVTEGLMLKALSGVFCAGEMLDWEAPTGGYLITGCLATGLWAGQHAAAWPP